VNRKKKVLDLDGIVVGYSDFLQLFNVDDPNDWEPNLRVCRSGVFVKDESDDLPLPKDIQVELSRHPDGDPRKPIIEFPTTLGEIWSRIGIPYSIDTVDVFDLAHFIANYSGPGSIARCPKVEKPLGTRERTTLLCIIGALARKQDLDLSQPMKAGDAVAAMAPELKWAGRTIGEHLKRVPEAMLSRK
jgi:hypothetical protein